MGDREIIESLIKERYENLHSSVCESLKRMKDDGLVVQLELHKTSTKFASERLYEVLNEFMNCWREKYIQKLQHDIEEAEITHDQILYKFQRIRSKIINKNKEKFNQTKELKDKKREILSNIKIVQTQIHQIGKGFGNLINGKEQKIAGATETLDIIKDSISTLRTDVDALKSKFRSDQAQNMRQFKQIQQTVKSGASKCVYGYDISELNESYGHFDSIQKEKEITRIKMQNTKLQSSLKTILNYINSISSATNVTEKVDESNFQNISKVITKVSEYKSQEYTQMKTQGLTINSDNFVQKVKSDYDEALLKKQQEIDEIMRQSKEKRKKLKLDLRRATQQLMIMRRNHEQFEDDDNDIFKEIQKSSRDLEATKLILDQTMGKLYQHSSSSRSNVD